MPAHFGQSRGINLTIMIELRPSRYGRALGRAADAAIEEPIRIPLGIKARIGDLQCGVQIPVVIKRMIQGHRRQLADRAGTCAGLGKVSLYGGAQK